MSIIGRRVTTTTQGYGNTKPETLTGTLRAVGAEHGDTFALLVEDDNGDLHTWDSCACSVLPEPPTMLERLVPSWARPHVVEAVAGGVIILGGLALVMAVL